MGLLENFDLGGTAKGLLNFIAMTNPAIREERAQAEERKRLAERQRMADEMAQQQFDMRKAEFDQQRGLLAQQQADEGLLKRGLLLPQMEGARPEDGMGPGAPVANKGIDPQWFLSQGGSVGGLGKALEINGALFPQTKPMAPMNVAPGGAIVDPGTGKLIFQAPFKPEDDRTPEQKNFAAAVAEGFKGSFTDYQKEIRRAGANNTSVNVNSGPKAFWTDFGKGEADDFGRARETARAAANTVKSLGELRKAAAGGAYQGAGAELKLGVAKALGAIGMPYDEKTVANTEAFNAQAKSFVLDTIKSLGANPSNADREFIEQTVPRLQTDPAALPRLIDFMENKARTSIRSYNKRATAIQSKPEAQFLPYSLIVEEPPATSNVDALLQKYGGK